VHVDINAGILAWLSSPWVQCGASWAQGLFGTQLHQRKRAIPRGIALWATGLILSRAGRGAAVWAWADVNRSPSHGCIHMLPTDRNEAKNKGYFKAGVTLKVFGLDDKGPPE